MKKLQLEEMETIEGGCRRFWCTVAVIGFFGAAFVSLMIPIVGLGVIAAWAGGIAACDGC